MSRPQVVCLPGSVAPAAVRYAPLKTGLGGTADLHLKELEVYRNATPPSDYSVDLELLAIDEFARAQGLERFHLIGYSGGGFLALAYAGTRRDRLQSLALFEPASVPGRLTSLEKSHFDALAEKLRGLEGPEFMAAFVREQLKPGVQLSPPPASTSPEMQKRPAGIGAMMGSFNAYEFDRSSLAACDCPVFLAYGDQTHEIEATKAGVLASLFPDVQVRRYSGIHHFVPPEMIYTADHIAALVALWRRAEG